MTDATLKDDPAGELTPDKKAAHQFLSELRTRIAVQKLPYQAGVEARALESLWELFGLARAAMKDNPGCQAFAAYTTNLLNEHVRPKTAKWHRAHAEGRLDSRDGSDEFRGDLEDVRQHIKAAADYLHRMAYGAPFADVETPDPMSKDDVTACMKPMIFGIGTPDILIKTDPVATDPAKADTARATIDAMNMAEKKDVDTRREKHGLVVSDTDAIGLALSGGGIRSSTFCLGAVQVLVDKGLLQHVDFLSTVSGGGYLGSFLTRRLTDTQWKEKVGNPRGPDPEPVRYMRQHAKYLTGQNLWHTWSLVAQTLAGMVLNWTAPVLIIALLALAVRLCSWRPDWAVITGGFGVVTAVALLAYGVTMRLRGRAGRFMDGPISWMIVLTAVVAVCWLIASGYQWIQTPHLPDWLPLGHLVAGAGLISTVLPAIIRFVPVLQNPKVQKIALKGALAAAGIILPIGAVALFYAFLDLGKTSWHWPYGASLLNGLPGGWLHACQGFLLLPVGGHHVLPPGLAAPECLKSAAGLVVPAGLATLAAITLLSAVVALGLLNINQTGAHRAYRNSLATTFVHTNENEHKPTRLATINQNGFAPYHLINATANLPACTSPALRDRKSDFFLFSKHFIGSPATGYWKTKQWRADMRGMDLSTAMAISGAAFSSNMGLASMPTLRALLTIVNVRLGYWLRQPETRPGWPGFFCLICEMTGLGMSETARWLNLSDGGHIENMGVYELLRRRCKFIVSIDGEADPASSFQGHLTLVRHAQIDFGVRIDSKLEDLRPQAISKFSKTHYMFCRIYYPNPAAPTDRSRDEIGLMLYVKLSATGNEAELIKRYRLNHPDFPHQTTLDQFFDEEQFEAYRELGAHVMDGLFGQAITARNRNPTSVHDWFESLAKNLLEPA